LGLSSGYDSGAIACALLKNKINFKAYIIPAREDLQVLKERMKLIPDYQYLNNANYQEEKEWIKTNVENFRYKIPQTLKHDSAALGLSKICRLAHADGRKVYLSGQGGDEIIADYALKPHLSTFKGKFPDKLYLWNNFYDGCQYSYLGKEEYVAGSHSVETRYPYLDQEVVQEFLWLKPELKNRYYKAPLYEYLKLNKFPNLYDKKIGLSIYLHQ
jgi:asparagine synthetase B (glutamine-hydrolysing)